MGIILTHALVYSQIHVCVFVFPVLVAVIAIFGFLVLPITRGILSTVTPPDKQGTPRSLQTTARVGYSVYNQNSFLLLLIACHAIFVHSWWFTIK